MILYLLDHRHWIDRKYYDTKFIGIYSSNDVVLNTIEKYSQLPGFCDFKSDFNIEMVELDLNNKRQKKEFVYLLTGTQMVDEDEITISYSVYSNLLIARLLWIIKTLAAYGNKKFYVERYYINEDNWKDGFVILE